MIYAALTLWLFLMIFMGLGIYRLLAAVLPAAWVNWALLPGTVVSEMAYIFGCLITGGEVRRAKLMDSSSSSGGGKKAPAESSAPATEASGGLKVVGPIIASLIAIVACMAGIVVVHALLGQPVMEHFTFDFDRAYTSGLQKELPASVDEFWDQLSGQIKLLRRMCLTIGELDWLDWRVLVFVYVSACLAIRLAPVKRDMRATLAATVAISLLIALAGAISKQFDGLIQDVWPLVTYVWTSLLFMLVCLLLIRGLIGLIGIFRGKAKKSPAK